MRRNLALVEDRLQALEERRQQDPHLHAVFAPTYHNPAPAQPQLLPQTTNPYAAAAAGYQHSFEDREQRSGGGSAFTVTSVPMTYTPPLVQRVVPIGQTQRPTTVTTVQQQRTVNGMQRTPQQQQQTQSGRVAQSQQKQSGRAAPVARAQPQQQQRKQQQTQRGTVAQSSLSGTAAKQHNSGGKGSVLSAGQQALLKGIDKEMQQLIMREIVDDKPSVSWDDVAGLHEAKQCLMEMVILPALRPDLFNGLRSPPNGLLLFGPPGNGKTMLAKAVASESNCTFFSISASSLVSKYLGDSEKLVRALFAIARVLQPAIVFIDEIDALVPSRGGGGDGGNMGLRRLLTELLVQMDGVTSNAGEARVVVMGATNRPMDVDAAARRRLFKRIYIPLPCVEARLSIVQHLLKGQKHSLSPSHLSTLAEETEGYSGSDLSVLCTDAALEPIRELGRNVANVRAQQIRPISLQDFRSRMRSIRPSVDSAQLRELEEWNQTFGSTG